MEQLTKENLQLIKTLAEDFEKHINETMRASSIHDVSFLDGIDFFVEWCGSKTQDTEQSRT